MKTPFASLLFLLLAHTLVRGQTPDLVLADFEGETYGAWQTTGTAFGNGPAQGALGSQMKVEGFAGHGLANSFHGGDKALGTLTSPEFRIERKFLKFLIGGGGFAGQTCLNLVIDGKVVRTATGPNTEPGGSERLDGAGWDVAEFAGKAAHLVLVDDATGGWGHINVDQIVLSDTAPPPVVKLVANVLREVVVTGHWLNFPVKTGEKKRVVTVSVAGQEERHFDIELADGETEWWAPLDVSAWNGQTLTIAAKQLPEGSRALDLLPQSEVFLGPVNLYHERLRPQLQFSPKRGWTNDPNGLVYFHGEYHLFFQHNPYGWAWGNMHWGHATSPDLIHWTEHGEALYPDAMGPMFSGSAVVDARNTSGLGQPGQAPLVLMYTAAGKPTVQCLASSLDGRHFTKFAGNPVLPEITGGNRDPKVMWYEPTRQWVLTLYVGLPGEPGPEGKPKRNDTIHFFTSPNLRDWTLRSTTPGFYECPDFFPLPLDGDSTKQKWVLTAASSEYEVGSFDGEKFTPETPKLPGHRGRGFYAAQTVSGTPDGRRIQIGWGQYPSPGMPFNQVQAFPCELTLHSTPEGPRLAWQPIAELDSLRVKSHRIGAVELGEGAPNPLAAAQGELLEIRAEFTPSPKSEVLFQVRGQEIRYDAEQQELAIGKLRAPAPLREGRQSIVILTDRTSFTIWAADGLAYIPYPVIARPEDLSVAVSTKGGSAKFSTLEAHELKSIWP